MHRTSLASLILLALGAASPARAEQPAPAATANGPAPFEEKFKRADVDHDGKLTAEEARAAGLFTDGSFKEFDEDRDGTVTLFELGDALQQRVRQSMSAFDRADTDQDGYVSETEARAAGPSLWEIFKRASRGNNDRMSRDDLDLYMRSSFYSETSDRGVVPNIFNKRF